MTKNTASVYLFRAAIYKLIVVLDKDKDARFQWLRLQKALEFMPLQESHSPFHFKRISLFGI
jgi:hypothetical protein